ncbi:RapZ C-terminal domain-containing protein [Allonocardiopsis opalescens]|uniref:UPF0042 nucleotide-binding protein n=1 Tax=Allonocardiopsis opalescens TaxID=1144618 RepID=A0A2T0PSY2_9ACTN|nr:UPF0042 nucleotide-binding protein [Allonocardiopsis opalescens]
MIEIISFGYLHGPPPDDAHITVDLRHHFRDPHVAPELRYMTAHDKAVRDAVRNTPGIPHLIRATARTVAAMQSGPSGGHVRVAVGCAGGRHRAPSVALLLQARLGAWRTTITHRDIAEPVVERTGSHDAENLLSCGGATLRRVP